MSKLTSLIKKEFEQNQDLNTILTFKGIKLSELPNELKIKCIDYDFWEDDKINTKKLKSVFHTHNNIPRWHRIIVVCRIRPSIIRICNLFICSVI